MALKTKVTRKKTSNPIPTVWGCDGYQISRSKNKTAIPMKLKGPGYTVRKGYTYTVHRPDGTKVSRKAYSKEDAEEIVKADRAGRL